MSRLPYLNQIQSGESVTGTFKGINQNVICGDGEFASMKNMCCKDFPAISTRRHRGESAYLPGKCNGILWKNGIFYIDGTACYYKGELISGLTVTDDKKLLVGMGAYITIWPDKKVYNTNDGTFKDMQVEFKSSNLTYEKNSATDTTHIKITAEGISHLEPDGTSSPFSVYDSIDIKGCSIFGDADTTVSKTITSVGEGYIVIPGIIESTQTQSTEVTFTRVVPDMDFICERDNRLWGCSSANHEIYSSKLGDPSNWMSYEQISTDSYAATVGSDGDFTGIAAFSSYMLFFKENSVHILRGDKPSNYSMTEKKVAGVRTGCSASLAAINDTMFYVNRDGVFAFDGAVPMKVSEQITEELTDGVAGVFENRYYLSCKMGGKQTLLVYDPEKKIWDVEDDTKFDFATSAEGELYYTDGDEISLIYGDREEIVDWFLESGDISESMLDDKYIIGLKFNVWLGLNAHANIYVQCDDDPEWIKCQTIFSTKNKTYDISFVPRRCNKYRYRIVGSGEFKLLGVGRIVQRGGGVNGHVCGRYRR